MALDLVVRGGTVFDGGGDDGRVADVGVEGDRVVLVAPPGDLPDAPDARVLDATGLAVTPGFVNVLSHAWASLQVDGSGSGDLLQGVTTEVFGEAFSLGPTDDTVVELVESWAGFTDSAGGSPRPRLSFDRLADGLGHLERLGVSPNVASFVGGDNLRALGAGFDDRPLTSSELDRLVGLMTEEMADGALGIGTALIYPPGSFATTEELIALCRPVGDAGGTYISHLRSEGDSFLECLEELLLIGREAGCRAEVYHLKAAGQANWPKMRQAIALLQAARDAGQPVGANMYPYTAGATALHASIPPRFHGGGLAVLLERLADPGHRREVAAAIRQPSSEFENLFLAAGGGTGVRFLADLSDGTPARGRSLADLAVELGHDDPADALVDVVTRAPDTGVLYFVIDEANVELGLRLPWVSLGSDASASCLEPDEPGHPRATGTFARFLGHYVRERGVATFADAVRRLSSLPCEELGLVDRGRITPGAFADLVVLDPATVADRSTYDDPHARAVGVHHVVVNGRTAVEDGVVTDARPGRALRRGR